MSSPTRILVVDAARASACALRQLLCTAGFDAEDVRGLEEAAAPLARASVDVVLLALEGQSLNGVSRLAAMTDAQLVLLVGVGEQELGREALRMGACDLVERSRDLDTLLFALERAAHERRMRLELAALRARVGDEARQALVGRSAAMVRVRELAGRAAASRAAVVITGEAGTGKDVVARLVHDLSDRAARPYAIVHCEGIEPAVLENELFGGNRWGLLETLRGGTLVLDEPNALPPRLRSRVARVIAERTVARPGVAEPVPVDVRIVLTSRAAAAESIVSDRMWGSNTLAIDLPPLRERQGDLPLLVQHFRERFQREIGLTLPGLSSETMARLLTHGWPGIVRELEHWLERSAYAAARELAAPDVPVSGASEFSELDHDRPTIEELERRYILHVLGQEGGHQSRAAERLGIDRRTLYRKLKEYRARDEGGAAIRRAG
jgi:two-component system response regulator HydG